MIVPSDELGITRTSNGTTEVILFSPSMQPPFDNPIPSSNVRAFLDRALQNADLIFGARLHSFPIIQAITKGCTRSVPVILDLDECDLVAMKNNLDVLYSDGDAPDESTDRQIATTISSFRSLAIQHSASCFVSSPVELERIDGSNIVCVPNSYPQQIPLQKSETSKRLLFVGDLTYPPNIDAVEYFVNDIFPLVRERVPDATFEMAGFCRQDSPLLKALVDRVSALRSRMGVILSPNVEDIRTCYARASAAVIPLRKGAGAKIKVIESMALEVPFVTTSVGAAGIDLHHRQNALVADTAQTFAESCVQLLTSPALGRELSARAARTFELNYSETVIDASIASIVRRVLEAQATSAGCVGSLAP
jgi:glycosyltransferase involved in cell wall biosynthesis